MTMFKGIMPFLAFGNTLSESGRITQSSHSIMYVLEDGVHDEKTYATFSYLADAVLRFRINDSGDLPKHEVRMERMRGTETSREWHDFLIER